MEQACFIFISYRQTKARGAVKILKDYLEPENVESIEKVHNFLVLYAFGTFRGYIEENDND